MYYGNIASCPAILQDGYLERAIRVITSFLISLCSSSRVPRILHSCRRCLPTPNPLTPRSIFRVTASLIGSNPLKPQGFSNLFCSRTHQYVLPSETREGFQGHRIIQSLYAQFRSPKTSNTGTEVVWASTMAKPTCMADG
jgi:hypothetical protein